MHGAHAGALPSYYAFDDPRRFNLGTTSQVWNMIPGCFGTSDRIVADIMNFPCVVDDVIAHRGAVVPEINLRLGHRIAAINGGRALKSKVTNQQRKHLLKMGPVHPDAQALGRLLGRLPSSVTIPEEESEMLLTEKEIQEAQAEEAASMLEIEEIVIEDDCEDADAVVLDPDAVEDLIVAGRSFL